MSKNTGAGADEECSGPAAEIPDREETASWNFS
jgi:hypothetical protein